MSPRELKQIYERVTSLQFIILITTVQVTTIEPYIHQFIPVRLWRNFSFWSDGTRIKIIAFAEGIPSEVCN
jgi:hypothetical protein